MAARLWSPVLGCLATVRIVPNLPAPTQWQLRDDRRVQPCVPHPGGWIATEDADDVAALVKRIMIRNVLQPLAEEFRAEQPIARGLLWGNVASTGKLDDFRRRSCCLYYWIPGGGRCGDCALDCALDCAPTATVRSATPAETTPAELSHPSRQNRIPTTGYPDWVVTSARPRKIRVSLLTPISVRTPCSPTVRRSPSS
jgi:hypothetical protein